MAIWIGLAGVVLGSFLAAGFTYFQERGKVAAAARGGARLLAADLGDARAVLQELADERVGPERAAAALDEVRALWLTYRDRLATGLGGPDWQALALQLGHMRAPPGRADTFVSHGQLSTVNGALGEVERLLARLEMRWARRLLAGASARISAAASRPAPVTADAPAIAFSSLAAAHAAWRAAPAAAWDAAERRYRELLLAFEAQEGNLVAAFWSQTSTAAVALTRLRRTGWRALLEGGSEVRYHRSAEWIRAESVQAATLFHRCDTLAIRTELTTDAPERDTALSALLQVAARILDFADGGGLDDAAVRRFVATTSRELDEIEVFARSAAMRAARRAFLLGVGIFGVIVCAVAAAGASVAAATGKGGVATAIGAVAAGALGAAISVRLRTGGESDLVPELGRRALVTLGMFRPVIGALFGLALFFASRGFVPLPAFAVVLLALLAGFAERFARVGFAGTEHTPPPGHAPS